MCIDVILRNTNWSITVIYRSPSSSCPVFLDAFEDWCSDLLVDDKRVIIIGDFNIDVNSDGFYSTKLKNIFSMYGLEQMIDSFTRCTDSSRTIIDLVICNCDWVSCCVNETPKISDHFSICVNTSKSYKNSCGPDKIPKTKIIRNLNVNNLNRICDRSIDVQWPLNSCDVDFIYEDILKKCEVVLTDICPIKEIRIRQNDLPWYDCEVHKAAKDRDNAFKIFHKSTSPTKNHKWAIYKQKRNYVVNLLKDKKTSYFEEQIDSFSQNSKMMWKTLKTLIKPKNINDFGNLNIVFPSNDGTVAVSGKKEIAEKFNSYFIESVVDIVDSIPGDCHWTSVNYPPVLGKFDSFTELSMRDLKHILASLDNKCKPLEILSSKMLKTVGQVIGQIGRAHV